MNAQRLLLYLCLAAAETAFSQSLVKVGEEITVEAAGSGSAVEIGVTAVLKADRARHGMSRGRWGIKWNDIEGRADSIVLQWGNTDFGMESDQRFLRVTTADETRDVTMTNPGDETVDVSVMIDGRDVVWSVSRDLILARGRHSSYSSPDTESLKVFCHGRDLIVDRLEAQRCTDVVTDDMTPYTKEEDFPAPADRDMSPAGVWHYLDRDTDSRWSRPGGKYTLGVIAGEKGEWTIIYLDGAVTDSHRWIAGMKKGLLKESGFQRDFTLLWTDAMHNELDADDECSASLSDDGMILTLRFPLDKATLRFSRQL